MRKSKKVMFFIVFIFVVSTFSMSVYANFWDTPEKNDIENIRTQRAYERDSFVREGQSKKDNINLLLVGFDIERNQRAVQMLEDMQSVAKETGVTSTLLFAGNEDEIELQNVMVRTLDVARGRGSKDFSIFTVSEFNIMLEIGVGFSRSATTQSSSNATISTGKPIDDLVAEFNNVFEKLFTDN